MSDPIQVDTTDHSQRDAASLKILGFFFTVLGALVLIGTLWSLGNARAVTVNVASGALLVTIGLVMIVFARRGRKELPKKK